MLQFTFDINDLINQYALVGLPAIILVLGTLCSRYDFRSL